MATDNVTSSAKHGAIIEEELANMELAIMTPFSPIVTNGAKVIGVGPGVFAATIIAKRRHIVN